MRITADHLRRWLICVLAGFFLLNLALAWRVRALIREGYPDFIIFYAAGRIVSRGLGAQLYDESLQYQVQKEFALRIQRAPLPYFHPPFEALFFAPLSRISYFSAYLLWNALNLLILLAVRQRLRAHVPILQGSTAAAWILMQLAYFPVFMTLLHGQDTLVLLLLFTLTFVSLKRNHEFAAGGWLGLGLFRPHQVLPVVMVLILQKRGKAVLGFLLAAAGCGLMSLAVAGWQGTAAYPEYVWHAEERLIQQGEVVPGDMPNLHGLLDRTLAPLTSPRFSETMAVVATLVLPLFVARHWQHTRAKVFDLGFSLCITLSVLLSYHAFSQDLSLLVLPIALVINHLRNRGTLRDLTGAALLGPIGLLLLTPLQIFVAMHRPKLFSLMAPVLILWLVAMAREVSRVQRQADNIISR